MAKFVPRIFDPLLKYNPSDGVNEFSSLASKALRLKILLDRRTRGFEQADRNGPPLAYEHELSDAQKGGAGAETKSHRSQLKTEKELSSNNNFEQTEQGYTFEQPKSVASQPINTGDYISIVDLDYIPARHDEGRYYSKLILPFVPSELNYGIESSFVGIASFGRNNPIYQFTGSEDSLSFTIDWFSNSKNREDVIFNCRWIEALSKADGYQERPHRVMLVWGNDNKLFQDHVFLVQSAPYTLSQFVRGYKDTDGTVISTSMLPQQAIQNITLKRLTTENLLSKEIIGRVGKPINPNYSNDLTTRTA